MTIIASPLFEREGRFGKCKFVFLLLPLLLISDARAEIVSFRVKPNQQVEHTLSSEVDDSHLRDPVGYAQPGAQRVFFTRTITIENVGSEPLHDAKLVINGRDFSTITDIARALDLPADPGAAVRQFYSFWLNNRTHATSGAPESRHPVAVLNFWGYTFCGEDTNALEIFLQSLEIRSRKVPLNGHVAAEYFFDDKWNIIDGDQSAVYLHLDNRTLASYSEIRADPFLALRTKIFGRYAQMDPRISAYNASLFEHVEPSAPKLTKLREVRVPQPVQSLWPGEKLILRYDQPPVNAAGTTDLRQWPDLRKHALGRVDLHANAQRAQPGAKSVVITTGFPLVAVSNHSSGWQQSYANGEAVFKCAVPIISGTDRITLSGHRARTAFPLLSKGSNTIELRCASDGGEALVTFESSAAPGAVPPVVIKNERSHFIDESPLFHISSSDGGEMLWWQIADDVNFSFVAPNFESVAQFSNVVQLDLLTDTFLHADRTYFFRARTKRDGVWSDWSEPFEFQVRKPEAPEYVIIARDSQAVHLRWNLPQPDAEYLIFGSNRIDFLPELYADAEIVKMLNARVEESRPGKNLLATVSGSSAVVPAFRFYRIIAKRGAAYSVPSPLIRLPHALSTGVSPAKVLQTRWTTVKGAQYPNGYIDRYVSEELPLRDSR